MRMQCTLDDFGECWIEVTEKWTKREGDSLVGCTIQHLIEMWGRKVVACNLRKENGEYITQPADFTLDELLDLDSRFSGFVGASLRYAFLELQELGKTARRVSFSGSGAAKPA